MKDWLSADTIKQLNPLFPKQRGFIRGDDRKVLSGILYVLKYGLRWCDAPKEYGPYKTLYNRFVRWSDNGTFDKIFDYFANQEINNEAQIDSTHIKCHRTASSLLKKRMEKSERLAEQKED